MSRRRDIARDPGPGRVLASRRDSASIGHLQRQYESCSADGLSSSQLPALVLWMPDEVSAKSARPYIALCPRATSTSTSHSALVAARTAIFPSRYVQTRRSKST